MGGVSAESAKASRDRKRGGPPREPKPCGTIAAVRRHEYWGEELDPACEAARAEWNAEQYRKRKERLARKKGNQ